MHKLFNAFYLSVSGVLWLLATPYLLFLTSKQKYKHSLLARFYLFKNPPFSQSDIWFHGASLGEIRSFLPFIKLYDPVISSTTQTGFDAAKSMAKEARFLPFELFLPRWIKKGKVLVVTEAELWYMLFYVAKKRGFHTFLINARISDKSYKNYMRFRFFYKLLFSYVDFVFAQSEVDKKRLESIGAKNVVVNGNIKTASIAKPTKSYKKPTKKVITLASTHEGEESGLLNALERVENAMLIVVPRHPERFEEVKKLCEAYAKKYDLSYKYLSKDGFCECDILVCDTLGELINIYAITDITILCGSFVDGIGGHNPLECAFFDNVIISGKYIFNQKTLYPSVENIYFSDFSSVKSLLNKDLLRSSLQSKDALTPIKKELDKILEK